jgi:hypothetical protein
MRIREAVKGKEKGKEEQKSFLAATRRRMWLPTPR